jgi:hypothetical protein
MKARWLKLTPAVIVVSPGGRAFSGRAVLFENKVSRYSIREPHDVRAL